MKKQLLLSLLFLFLVNKNLWAQTTFTIPDVNFFNAVMTAYPSCSTCVVNYSTREIRKSCIDSLNIVNLFVGGKQIASLQGVEFFVDLLYLVCNNNQITSLLSLPNTLTNLSCDINQLNSLPSLPINLKSLSCGTNQLASLPPLPNTLTSLGCHGNQLLSLPTLPFGLVTLHCSYNLIDSLPPLPSSLTQLHFISNQIDSLPPLPSGLAKLSCGNNPIKKLPTLPASLTDLECSNNLLPSYNRLTSLPALPSGLISLSCGYNELICLPSLPSGLVTLSCHFNPLTSLPPLPKGLTTLSCVHTLLTCFPKIDHITSNLTISITNTRIACRPNLPPNITVTPSNLPICTDNYASPCQLYAPSGVEIFPSNTPRKVEATVIDMPFTTLPNDPILYERVNFQNQDWAVFGSDIMLCPMNQLNTFQSGTWNGKIPYDAANISDSIRKAINYWNVRAGLMGLHIAFVPKQANDAQWVKFFDMPNAYASRLGRVIGATEQEIWVDFQGYSGRILHELGHTAGLYHEHQRWDRDNYVNIVMNEVRAEYADNYCKLHDIQATPFDYQSLMHHWCYAFSETPPIDGRNIDTSDFKKTIIPLQNMGTGAVMGQRADFTPYDIQDFNQLYPTGIIGGIGPTGSGTYTLELAPAYQNLIGLTVTWSVSSSYIPPNGTAISATQNSTNPLKADVLAPQPTGSTTAARGFVIATIAHPSFGTKSYYKYVFRN